jgi:hypothetical protein
MVFSFKFEPCVKCYVHLLCAYFILTLCTPNPIIQHRIGNHKTKKTNTIVNTKIIKETNKQRRPTRDQSVSRHQLHPFQVFNPIPHKIYLIMPNSRIDVLQNNPYNIYKSLKSGNRKICFREKYSN